MRTIRDRTTLGFIIFLLFAVAVAFGAEGKKVNLNSATLEELDAVPGIGQKTAQRIIEMRPLRSLNDLDQLPGFSPARVDALKEYVTLGDTGNAATNEAPTEQKSLNADIQLAGQYLKDRKSPQPTNWKPIIAQWEQEAESPSARRAATARTKLGQCYLEGIGVNQDIAKGIRYYEGAAEANPESWRLFDVAKLYRGGGSVPADPAKEIYWTKKAAEAGSNVWAEYRLVQLYGNRDDSEPDYATALEWAKKAQQKNPPKELVKPLQEYVEVFSKLLAFPKPAVFEISVAGSPVKVSRVGTGPEGIIFFPHTGAKAMNKYILANQDWLKDLVPEKCSLFLWEYPKAAPFDKVQPILSAYMQGDKSANLPLPGVASSVIVQIREKTVLSQFLVIGNSLGAGIVLQDYAALVGDKALSFLLVSPTEAFMPPVEKIPPLERTTILSARGWGEGTSMVRPDMYLRGEKSWDWVAENRATEWGDLITKSGVADPSKVKVTTDGTVGVDPNAPTNFDAGHFTIGDKINAELLAKLIKVKLGMADQTTLAQPPQQREATANAVPHPKPAETAIVSDLKQAPGVPLRPVLPRAFPLPRPTREGKVVAWGFTEGTNGGTGDAAATARQLIQPPAGLNAVQVATSKGSSFDRIHTLALKADGTVAAWGRNDEGQCNVPFGLKDVVSIAAGEGVSLAIKADGTVAVWGSGKRFASLPTNLSSVVQAAFTQNGTLFLFADGTCRYVPESQRQGNGRMDKERINGHLYEYPAGLSSSADVDATIVAATAGNLVAIAGGRYGYGLTSGGKVIVFHLRDDPVGNIPKDLGPAAALPVTDRMCSYAAVTQIDGSVRAWGRNDTGQCDIPVGIPPIKSLSTSHDHTAAITTDEKLIIWGWNWSGERDIPAELSNAKFLQVAAGQGFNIAIVQTPNP